MSAHDDWGGIVITGSRCPKCHAELAYNGNYWCSECDYVMPDLTADPERRYYPKQVDIDAFNLAYVLLMRQRGEEPDPNALIL